MKPMQKEEIRRLLDLYMEGETSREEEVRLAEYFRSDSVDDEFADVKDLFALPGTEVPFVSEKELDAWSAEAGMHETRAEEAQLTAAPMPADRPTRFRHIVLRLAVAASIAAVAFFIGRQARPEQEVLTRTVTQTELRWKTDTVVIEKKIPVREIITVRVPVQVEPVKEMADEHLAAVPSAIRDTAVRPAVRPQQDSTAQGDLVMNGLNGEMPPMDEIQADFNELRKRMYEFSSQYESNPTSHDFTY